MGLPFWDEKVSVGQKRTFWRHDQAIEKRKEIKAEVRALRTKGDKPYSRADQQKIVAERWQEVVEKKPKPGEV